METNDNNNNNKNLLTIASASNLNLSVTCSICLEIFKNPKLLSCGHTFCFHCLSLLFNQQQQQTPSELQIKTICCALCQQNTSCSKVEELPKNYVAEELCEFLNKIVIDCKTYSCNFNLRDYHDS